MSERDTTAGDLWLRVRGDPAVAAFNAQVEPMGEGAPHEWSPTGGGVSVMVRGVAGPGGQAQLFVVTADLGTAVALAMCSLLPGDTVRVEGVIADVAGQLEQAEPIRVIRRAKSLQVVQRAVQPWQEQPNSARRAA